MNTSNRHWLNTTKKRVLWLKRLLSKEPETLKYTVERYSKLKPRPGVYIISDPKDEKIFWIGRSINIRRRLSDHYSRKEALQTYKATRKIVEEYLVRVTEEEDLIELRNLEDFGISVLKPIFNKG
jgi:excinuclease UvrABC nuclease subunit